MVADLLWNRCHKFYHICFNLVRTVYLRTHVGETTVEAVAVAKG